MDNSLSATLIHLCRAHRNLAESRLNALGLYAGQEAILLRLMEEEGPSLGELAGALGVEAPTMTKAVQRLEKGGFVRREADPEDARVSRVYLSPTGRRLGPEITAVWQAIEAQLTAGLTDAERVLLQKLLEQLVDNLQTE